MDTEVYEMLAILAEVSRKQSELIKLDRQISRKALEELRCDLSGRILALNKDSISRDRAETEFGQQQALLDDLKVLREKRDQLNAEIKALQDRLPTPAPV